MKTRSKTVDKRERRQIPGGGKCKAVVPLVVGLLPSLYGGLWKNLFANH